jgi:hypothetical protein
MRSIILIISIVGATLFIAKQNAKIEREPFVDPQISSLVEEWKDLMQANGIKYEAGFKRIDNIIISNSSSHAGLSDKINRIIYLDIDEIKRGPYTSRVILYHELGHYVFNLKHCHEKSIMYHNCLSEDYYKDNYDILVKEYLTKCKSKEYEGRF